MRISKFLLIVSLAPMSFAPALPAQAHIIEEEPTAQASAKKPTARLSVNGQGTSYQEPDTAHVSVGVIATGKTAEDAMALNGEKMSAARDALLAAGVARKHIQTSGLNLNPVYNNHGVPSYSSSGERTEVKERKIISYTVQNRLSVKTHDIDRLGPMLDALVKAGSNNIAGIRFSLKDDSLAKAEARKAAMKDARVKAETMAEGAGVELGRILLIGEGANYNHAYSDEIIVTGASGGGYSSGGTVVQSGQQKIIANVNMMFEIIQ